jgi:mannose-6-phosphate isomerase-like protein (cupin superfamily)
VLYSKGVRLPGGGGPSSFALTFGQHLYTYQSEISSWDFNTYAFGPDGLIPRTGTGGLISGNLNIRGDGNGRIYTNLGTVIDPEAHHVLAQMPDGSWDSNPVADPRFNRVFFLNRDHIAADDYSTFVALDRLKLPGVTGGTNLIRWGEDGFAFRTATQVCWLRSFIVGKPVTPADLSVAVTHSPQSVQAGSAFSCKIVVVNNGPGFASAANLTLTLAQGWSFVSARSGSGRVTIKDRIVDVDVGDMKPGDRVTMNVDVAPRTAAQFFMTATIRADQWDNHPGNNIVDHVIKLSFP